VATADPHIWIRSRQLWITLPEGVEIFQAQLVASVYSVRSERQLMERRWETDMSILKSLFQMGLSVLRAALRVAVEIALTHIAELVIFAA
jgi:hypothetical protein